MDDAAAVNGDGAGGGGDAGDDVGDDEGDACRDNICGQYLVYMSIFKLLTTTIRSQINEHARKQYNSGYKSGVQKYILE